MPEQIPDVNVWGKSRQAIIKDPVAFEQRESGKRRIWEHDPDFPGRMRPVWVADETREKGQKQIAREKWQKQRREIRRENYRGLSKTWTPAVSHTLWLMLIAIHLRQLGAKLPEPAIQVDAQKTLDALFDDPGRAGEVFRRITHEDQSEALRALPSRYLSQKAYDELARERAKLLGWYAARLHPGAPGRP